MTQILGNDKQGLIFEIISARIQEENQNDKKHVIYILQIKFITSSDDTRPSVIERRYSDFLKLHNSLRNEYPTLMANVGFPKKALMGNFNNDLISSRSTEFESLLRTITSQSRLRTSSSLFNFLNDIELTKAKIKLLNQDYQGAAPILEENFILLNKVFTDRSPQVLLALCRLFACSLNHPERQQSVKWADLTLHRYEGVSDSDLLQLYVPLLKACLSVYTQFDKDTAMIKQRLEELRFVNVKENLSLLEEIENVETKIFAK